MAPDPNCPNCDKAIDEQIWLERGGQFAVASRKRYQCKKPDNKCPHCQEIIWPPIWMKRAGQFASARRKNHAGGAPRSRKKRCPCGANTLHRARARNFGCCKTSIKKEVKEEGLSSMIEHLTELQYSDDLRHLRLYVYRKDGRGYEYRSFFSKVPRYPDEEVPIEEAKTVCDLAVAAAKEVRITNSGDFLVFHAVNGTVLYPADGAEGFWERVTS